MSFRGHALISGNSVDHQPAFLNAETNSSKVREFLVDYVFHTVDHYKGDAFSWTVVEDAVDDTTFTPRNIKFNQVQFDDYICEAFRYAKAADPNPRLYYADYGIHSTAGTTKDKAEAVYRYVTTWGDATNKCGVQGVAMKINIATNVTDEEINGVRDNIKRYMNATNGPFFVDMTQIEVTCEL